MHNLILRGLKATNASQRGGPRRRDPLISFDHMSASAAVPVMFANVSRPVLLMPTKPPNTKPPNTKPRSPRRSPPKSSSPKRLLETNFHNPAMPPMQQNRRKKPNKTPSVNNMYAHAVRAAGGKKGQSPSNKIKANAAFANLLKHLSIQK